MSTSAASSLTRSRRSASRLRLCSSVSHWSSSTSSAASTDNAIARFFGEWNWSQSRAAANSASLLCSSAIRSADICNLQPTPIIAATPAVSHTTRAFTLADLRHDTL